MFTFIALPILFGIVFFKKKKDEVVCLEHFRYDTTQVVDYTKTLSTHDFELIN